LRKAAGGVLEQSLFATRKNGAVLWMAVAKASSPPIQIARLQSIKRRHKMRRLRHAFQETRGQHLRLALPQSAHPVKNSTQTLATAVAGTRWRHLAEDRRVQHGRLDPGQRAANGC
jgi:hypothetical protein